jgi:hypothetical protein
MRLNWGTGIALVYGLFAAGTVGFVAFAMSRPVQLVDEDYYASSLRHDERRAAIENAATLAPDAVSADADGRGVTIVLPPGQHDARGVATLYRPSDASADRQVPLALDATGRQRLSFDGLAAGRWVVQVAWTSGGRTFYREIGVTAP